MPASERGHAGPPRPHLIFDFGGVLFRWRPAELLARLLPGRIRSSEEAEHWKRQFFQAYQGDWGAFDSGLISAEECRDRISARTGLSRQEVQAVIDAVPAELMPQQETVAILQALKTAGHRLFFLSNMPEPYARHLEQHHAFLAWFEDGVFSARVKTGKPGLDIFRLALERFGVAAQDALFIDDHVENIQAASQLALPALHFTSAARLAQDLRARGLSLPVVSVPGAIAGSS